MEDINEYFNPVHFTKFYNEKLKRKKGGGLDGLTPATFWNHYEKKLDDIASRCLSGTYKFSPYKEQLIRGGAFFNGKEGRDDFRKLSFWLKGDGGIRKKHFL